MGQTIIERTLSPKERLVPLNVAIAEYDRTRPLLDGRVKAPGLALNITSHYNGDFCERPVYEEYDAAEMSFSWYVMARSRGEPVIALPIFPLRMPVLAYILVRKDSPDWEPKDLKGKRLCVASYRFTVNLWLRGILRDQYGLAPEDVTWVTCGTQDRMDYVIPPSIKVVVDESDPPAQSFQELLDRPAQLLEHGEVDAIIVPELPHSFVEGRTPFRRLFRNAQRECQDYVRRTGFLPVTHVMVMHQSLGDREPWIVQSLLQAFVESQQRCDEFLFADPKNLSMPDSVLMLEEHRKSYGQNIWTHGLVPNRSVLEIFLLYAFEQTYTSRRLSIEEAFCSGEIR